MNNNTFELDKITWNDLSLEEVFSRLNSCISSAGEDYLYNRLKNPFITDCEDFRIQSQLLEEAELYKHNASLIKALQKCSKLKHYSFLDEIENIKDEKTQSNLKHYIIGLLVIAAFLLFFVSPGPAIVLFFLMIAYAVSDYFKSKNIIAGKLAVFNYLIKMIKAFSIIENDKSNISAVFYSKISRLLEIKKAFSPFLRGTFLISEGARTTSNPFSMLFDYLRMIFHVDIIKYNSMICFLQEHLDEAKEFYNIVGEIDAVICISNISEIDDLYIGELCKPTFCEENKYIKTSGIYHPLVKNAVKNTIETSKSILLTGCNASGKSTFLKTIALNCIFAQSFGVCFADSYTAPYYKVYSSMALKDDISQGESYFMSEIKSLKRVVDCKNDSVLCVVDEVLRGTNTVERIAASVEILKKLDNDNVLCFAATHDIELTELLADDFINYHFEEEIAEDDVRFSFLLKEGPASTRNAIRLLSILGYDQAIVESASNRADQFMAEGKWYV